MIQRIQTLFLLLAAVVFGVMFTMPIAVSNEATAQFLADKVFEVTDHPVLIGLTVGGAILSFIAIFLFKNRKVQIKLGYLIIVLAILLPVLSYVLFMNEAAAMNTIAVVSDQAGMFLPAGAILFAALANYFIRKDDKLVKSMDRLR